MRKCPYCNNPLDYGRSRLDYIELLRLRSKRSQTLINKVVRKIDSTIPSERNKWKATNFMNAVKQLSDEQLEHVIDQYMYHEYYKDMKGYDYLKKMAINMFMNWEQKKEGEIARIGKTPKIVDPKEYK